ncbi:MAG: 50S ribosomal protein L11 methyltransferase [Sandaracinaceae bacterium]
MTPRYPLIRVEVSVDEMPAVSQLLFELGASGLEEQDEMTLERAPPGRVRLVAHFDDEANAERAAEEVGGELGFIEGDDWRDAWKAFFKPTRIGARLVVRPSWEPFDAKETDVVIVLDPGQAFGTGTHESTRLVLSILEGVVGAGDTVLDVGCGSGILSIGALLLGAGSARAIDIDPIAVRTTLENAEVNGVTIAASTEPVERLDGAYRLVLANIQRVILVPMKDALVARLEPGGVLVLSGLLVIEEEELMDAFGTDARLRFLERREDGEWLALAFARGDA